MHWKIAPGARGVSNAVVGKMGIIAAGSHCADRRGLARAVVLVTLHVLVCFVLIIVIMLQSGSAADLAGAFGGAGSQTAFGPRGAATFLSHATTWCAIVFMMTSLTLSVKRAPERCAQHRLNLGADPEVRHGSGETGSDCANSDSDPADATAGAAAGTTVRACSKAGGTEPATRAEPRS